MALPRGVTVVLIVSSETLPEERVSGRLLQRLHSPAPVGTGQDRCQTNRELHRLMGVAVHEHVAAQERGGGCSIREGYRRPWRNELDAKIRSARQIVLQRPLLLRWH